MPLPTKRRDDETTAPNRSGAPPSTRSGVPRINTDLPEPPTPVTPEGRAEAEAARRTHEQSGGSTTFWTPLREQRTTSDRAGEVDLTYGTAGARRTTSAGLKDPFPEETTHAGASVYTQDPFLLSPEEWDEVYGGAKTVGLGAIDVFSAPGRYTQVGLAHLGAFLPEDLGDPGLVGDYLDREAALTVFGGFEGASIGVLPLLGSFPSPGVALLGFGVTIPSYLSGTAKAELDPDGEYAKVREAVGRQMYQAIASGELARKTGDSPVLKAVPYLQGVDVIDTLVSKEQAAQLAESAPDISRKAAWWLLSTDPGRELYGAIFEMAVDPLWFAGPASGATKVSVADEVVTVPSRLVRAASAIARSRGLPSGGTRTVLEELVTIARRGATAEDLEALADDVARAANYAGDLRASAQTARNADPQAYIDDLVARRDTAIKAVQSLTADVQAGVEGSAEAAMQAKRVADAAAKDLARVNSDPRRAQKFLARDAKVRSRAANRADGDARMLAELTTELRHGTSPSLVTPTGLLSWHIPGTSRTRYIIPASVRKAAGKIPSLIEPADLAAINAKVGTAVESRTPLREALTTAEYMSYRAQQHALLRGGQEVYRGLWGLPQTAWHVIGRTMGTRNFQSPLVEHELLRTMQTGAVPDEELVLRKFKRVRKADPRTWDAYQSLVGKFFDKLNADTQWLNGAVNRIYDAANRTLRYRRHIARQYAQMAKDEGEAAATVKFGIDGATAKRWASKDYIVQNVVDEALDVHERGGGFLDERPDIAAMLPVVQDFVKEMADRFGQPLETIEQALVAVARQLVGDPDAWREVVAIIEGSDELAAALLTKGGQGAEQVRDALTQWAALNETLVGAFAAQNRPEFIRGVLEVHKAAAGAVVPLGDVRKMALRAFYDSFPDIRTARRALRHVAANLGVSTDDAPHALMLYILRGEGAPDPADITKGLDAFLAELNADADVAIRVLTGAASATDEADAVRKVLTAKTYKRLIVMQEGMGDHWKDFVRAADAWAKDGDASHFDGIIQDLMAAWNVSHESTLKVLEQEATAWFHVRRAAERVLKTHNAVQGTKVRGLVRAPRGGAGLLEQRMVQSVIPRVLDAMGGADASDEARLLAQTAEAWARGTAPEVVQASGAGLGKVRAKAETVDTLKKMVDKVAPKLTTYTHKADGTPWVRDLRSWEEEMTRMWQSATRHLSPENRMLAAFLALKDAPHLVSKSDPRYEEAAKLYHELMGARYVDVPQDLRDVIYHARALLDGYEQRYLEAGFSFVKDQIGRLRDWGTINYVPHIISPSSRTRAGASVSAADVRETASGLMTRSGGRRSATVEKVLDTIMGSRKRRAVTGAVTELNAAAAAGDFTYTLEPQAIIARYAQANRVLNAKEFLEGMVASGVARKVHRTTAPRALRDEVPPVAPPPATAAPVAAAASGMDLSDEAATSIHTWMDVFHIPEEQAVVVAGVCDTLSRAWGRRRGVDPKVWWRERLAAVMSFDEFKKGQIPNLTELDAEVVTHLADAWMMTMPEGFRPNAAVVHVPGTAQDIIVAFQNPDLNVVLHELAHVAFRDVFPEDLPIFVKWANDVGIPIRLEGGGITGDPRDVRNANELFAEGFEEFCRTGRSQNPELRPVFERLKAWLTDLWQTLTYRGRRPLPQVPDEMVPVYDRLFSTDATVSRNRPGLVLDTPSPMTSRSLIEMGTIDPDLVKTPKNRPTAVVGRPARYNPTADSRLRNVDYFPSHTDLREVLSEGHPARPEVARHIDNLGFEDTENHLLARVVSDAPWFHGTSLGSAQLQDYDMLAHSGSGAGNYFGPGLYLALDPGKAAHYASRGKIGTTSRSTAVKAVDVRPRALLDLRTDGHGLLKQIHERIDDALEQDDYLLADKLSRIADELYGAARGGTHARIRGSDLWGRWWRAHRNTHDADSLFASIVWGNDTLNGKVTPPPWKRPDDGIIPNLGGMAETLGVLRPLFETKFPLQHTTRKEHLSNLYDMLREFTESAENLPHVSAKDADDIREYVDVIRESLHRYDFDPADLEVRVSSGEFLRDFEFDSMVDDSTMPQRLVSRREHVIANALHPEWTREVDAAIQDRLASRSSQHPIQVMVDAGIDGVLHYGDVDGNVLILFDPSGKTFGKHASVTTEGRVLPDIMDEHVLFMDSDNTLGSLGRIMDPNPPAVSRSPSAATAASGLDLVPLFSRPSVTRDIDLLTAGTRADWSRAGVTPEEVREALAEVAAWRARPKGALHESSPFASWAGDVGDLSQMGLIEERVLAFRARNIDKNEQELFDPKALYDGFLEDILDARRATAKDPDLVEARGADIKAAWVRVAELMNDPDTLLDAGIRAPSNADLVSWRSLRDYYDGNGPAWQLYVPASVYQSMDDLLNAEKWAPKGWLGAVKSVMDRVNTFFKVRYTIVNTGFTFRNWVWNNFSNVLDLGPFGALNPRTQFEASRAVIANSFVNEFGNLDEAFRALSEGRRADEVGVAGAARFQERQAKLAVFKAAGVNDLRLHGVDMGNGVLYTGDEYLKLLRDNNILSGAYTNMADLVNAEEAIATAVARGDTRAWTQRIKNLASRGEDVAMVGYGFLGAGLGGLGVVLPKGLGRTISHFVEDQGRVMNFLGNFRRHHDVDQAAAHVQKFLFNYDDLTAFQRIWMRTIVPFWTWTSKNIVLQTQMMMERPQYYAMFDHMLVHTVPAALERLNHLERGETPPDMAMVGPGSKYEILNRPEYARDKIRIPLLGHKNAYIEGIGSPVEAYVETLNNLYAFARVDQWKSGRHRPQLRVLAQTHFLARAIAEYFIDYNTYYQRPISELTSGRQVAQTVAAFRRIEHIPVIGAIAGLIANGIIEFTKMNTVASVNPHSGFVAFPVVDPRRSHIFANTPYRQVIGNVADATDFYHLSLIDESAGGEINVTPLDAKWMWIDALTYIKVRQDDPAYRSRYEAGKRLRDYNEYLESRKALRETDLFYQPKR